MLHIGHGVYVNEAKVVAMAPFKEGSSLSKALLQEAKGKRNVHGRRKRKALVLLEDGTLWLSPMTTASLAGEGDAP